MIGIADLDGVGLELLDAPRPLSSGSSSRVFAGAHDRRRGDCSPALRSWLSPRARNIAPCRAGPRRNPCVPNTPKLPPAAAIGAADRRARRASSARAAAPDRRVSCRACRTRLRERLRKEGRGGVDDMERMPRPQRVERRRRVERPQASACAVLSPTTITGTEPTSIAAKKRFQAKPGANFSSSATVIG